MALRVATVFAGVPNPWQAGGPLTHWALVSALVERGHEVTFVALPWDDPPEEERLARLRALGARIVIVDTPGDSQAGGRWAARARYLRSIAWPAQPTLFPTLSSAPALEEVIADIDPDVVVAHGTPAVSAAAAVRDPKLALVSDPPGLTRRLRTRWDPQYPRRLGRDEVLYRAGSATYALRADRAFLAFLRRYDSVGMFAAHRVGWARSHGISAWYAKSPIVDAAGAEWRRGREDAPPNAKPRILLIGHLRGISTISGLRVFAGRVLPGLTSALGADGFEARIVGAYPPPRSLRAALDHRAVRLVGPVEPADEEFLRADVLLVPTPVETGPRVRILTGMSFGCCIVAHCANRLGIAAVAHEVNVLLAPGGRLAAETLRALADPALRARLGEAGRRTYEAAFTAELAGGRIADELERLA